ncbi:MAG: hypothetical protein Q8K65_04850 [Alphaproteobacteria bacterium]|nr:hypothetical protein [Alphaproteobacteria bacterium]
MPSLQIRPINFYKRDRDMFNHIAAKTLNSRNVIEIEYGEYPMKGIDIAQVNQRRLSVRGYFEDPQGGWFGKVFSTLFSLGYVRNEKIPTTWTPEEADVNDRSVAYDRAIYLNKVFYSPLAQAAVLKLAHAPLATAAYAVAVGAKTIAATAGAALGVLKNNYILSALLLSSARWATAVQILTMPFKSVMDTVGHEHIHVLQVHDEHKTGFMSASQNGLGMCEQLVENKRAENSLLSKIYAADNLVSVSMLTYLRKDAEIQARLHTVLAQGYREKWHRLPETRHEAWGALISMGLNAPAAIRRELDESTEAGLGQFYQKGLRGAFGRAVQKTVNVHVAQLNAAHASLLTTDVKEKYWRDVLPYLYGHLVELYGDPSGRRRMGITEDPARDFAKVSARVTAAPEQSAAPEQDTAPKATPAAPKRAAL